MLLEEAGFWLPFTDGFEWWFSKGVFPGNNLSVLLKMSAKNIFVLEKYLRTSECFLPGMWLNL